MSSARWRWLYFEILPSLAPRVSIAVVSGGTRPLRSNLGPRAILPGDSSRRFQLPVDRVAGGSRKLLSVQFPTSVVPAGMVLERNFEPVGLGEDRRRTILDSDAASTVGIASAVVMIPVALVIGSSAIGTGDLESSSPRHLPVKEAGLWLRADQPVPKNIFSSTMMAYYADAYQLIFPYADSELALRYIHKMNPDFIVIEQPSSEAQMPYSAGWAKQGIPDSRAKLIYEAGTPQSGRVQIYSWSHRSDP